ncbi:hypothetical protein ACFL0D_01855, partial [Thermoproteota archaeon]
QVAGGSYSVGEAACTIGIGSEDYSSIELDASRVWKFDIEVTVTAKSVDDDTTTAANIIVTTE